MTMAMSREFRHGDNIAVLALDPGHYAHVADDSIYDTERDICIEGIVGLLEFVDMKENTGNFLNWRGETLPW